MNQIAIPNVWILHTVIVKHGDATCARRIECRANGVKYGLSGLRFRGNLRTLFLHLGTFGW